MNNAVLEKILACPDCGKGISENFFSTLKCEKCGRTFSKKKNLIFFTAKSLESNQKKESEEIFWKELLEKSSFESYDQKIYAAFKASEYSELFENFLPKKTFGIAIDVGCGTGVSTKILSERGYFSIGCDLSPELLEIAFDFNKSAKNSFFIVADAEKSPFAKETADVVFFGGVLHHFPNYGRVLEEAWRVLKKNGKIIAIEPNWFDFPAQFKFFVSKRQKKQTENEYPISPFELKKNLEKKFEKIRIIYPDIDHSNLISPRTKRENFNQIAIADGNAANSGSKHSKKSLAAKAFGKIAKILPKFARHKFFAVCAEKK